MESGTEKKVDVVVYQLLVSAGARGAMTEQYKFHVHQFDAGSPQELITLVKSFEEVWGLNSIGVAIDCISITRSVLCGESLSLLELALVGV